MIKRISLICITTLLLLCFVGCTTNPDDKKLPGDTVVLYSYDIKSTREEIATYFDVEDVQYPKLVSAGTNNATRYSGVNGILWQGIVDCIQELIRNDMIINTVKLSYNVTFQDETMISVLFKGSAVKEGETEPTDIAFPVSVSLDPVIRVVPAEMINFDELFFEDFRQQVQDTEDKTSTDDKWDKVKKMVETYSDAELKTLVESSKIALTKNGMIIFFPVETSNEYIEFQFLYDWIYVVPEVEIRFEQGILKNKYWNNNYTMTYTDPVISDKETAIAVSSAIHNSLFPNSNHVPQEVFYDEEDHVWLVTFHEVRDEGFIGGEWYIALQKEDGKVLRMWFTD